MTAILSCRNLWKVYGPHADAMLERALARPDPPGDIADQLARGRLVVAACDVSFDVAGGEIFVIMGLSGSGKSTVVRCLSRLIEPTTGEILLDGRDLLKLSERQLTELRRHKMGMVFQHFGLLPHLNVLDNVAYPLRVQGMARERTAGARPRDDRAGRAGRPRSWHRRASSRAACSSVSASPGASRSSRTSGFSTSPSGARSADPPPDAGRVPRLQSKLRRPSCSSPMISRRHCGSPTASPSCGTAASCRSARRRSWC